nr:MAG TPA: hypothetical protein [Caudoviricetes sp.]
MFYSKIYSNTLFVNIFIFNRYILPYTKREIYLEHTFLWSSSYHCDIISVKQYLRRYHYG